MLSFLQYLHPLQNLGNYKNELVFTNDNWPFWFILLYSIEAGIINVDGGVS